MAKCRRVFFNKYRKIYLVLFVHDQVIPPVATGRPPRRQHRRSAFHAALGSMTTPVGLLLSRRRHRKSAPDALIGRALADASDATRCPADGATDESIDRRRRIRLFPSRCRADFR
jgi:hypothetical protein